MRNPPANGAVPDIVTEYVPGTALVPTFRNSCEVALLPGERFTCGGLIPIPTFNGMFNGEIVTCPENPFRLIRVAIEVPEEPVDMIRLLGERDRLKLG